MNYLKYIIRMLVSLVANPSETWQSLDRTDNEASQPAVMFRNFYYPLLGIVVLVLLLCEGFRGAAEGESFSIQTGMTRMVPVLVAYFVGPYLSIFFMKLVLDWAFHVSNPDKRRLEILVFYGTGYLLALEMLYALIPSIQFFKFFAIYLFYIIWCSVSIYDRIEVGRRWAFTLYTTTVIYSCPNIICRLITLVQG